MYPFLLHHNHRYYNFLLSSSGDTVTLTLADKSWLRRAMFSPASPAARAITCKMVEAMCQVPARKRQMLDMLTE